MSGLRRPHQVLQRHLGSPFEPRRKYLFRFPSAGDEPPQQHPSRMDYRKWIRPHARHYLGNMSASVGFRRAAATILFSLPLLLARCAASTGSDELQTSDPQPVDFYAAFPTNTDLAQTPAFSFLIAGSPGVAGTVDAPGLAYSTGFITDAGGLATLSIPLASGGMQNQWDAVQDHGFILHADDAVSVVAVSDVMGSMGAFTVPPASQLGTDFLVVSYGAGGTLAGSFLSIVGSADDTSVTISPSAAASGHAAGIPFGVALDRGGTYQLAADAPNADLTGTVVQSDKPIAVFGGHVAAQVPVGETHASFLCAPLPPLSAATGTEFVTAPFAARAEYRLRIVGLQDTTALAYAPSSPAGAPSALNLLQSGVDLVTHQIFPWSRFSEHNASICRGRLGDETASA